MTKWTRGAEICGLSMAAIGVLTIVAWLTGLRVLAAISDQYIPMAPATALVFTLLGLALFAPVALPESHFSRVAALIISILVYSAAGLILVQYLTSAEWDVERGILASPQFFHGVPEGRMSPVTAGTFLLAALAMSLWLSTSSENRRLRDAAGLLSFSVVLIGCVLVSGYILGSPFFYNRSMIPVALPTAAAFAILGIGILLALGPNVLPARLVDVSGIPVRLLVIFFLLMGGIAAVGTVYYLHQRDLFMRTVKEQLSSVAELKISQIENWRKERLGDARTIRGNPLVAEALKRFERGRHDARLEMEFSEWLTALKENYDYRDVLLMDAEGRALVAAEGTAMTVDRDALHLASQAMADGSVRLTDFHIGSVGWIHLDILVPVLDPDSKVRRPLGLVFLRIDPNLFLYPLMQLWPTPSPTAETLLVRREGDEVVFLNELRHRKKTTLELLFPVERQDLPAAMAVRGITGVVQGRDYRGIPVVAAIGPIPDSSWFIVSKVDAGEIFRPLRRQSTLVGLAILLGIAFSGSAVFSFWRRQQAAFAAQEALVARESMERYYRTLENMLEGCQIIGSDWRFIYVNDVAAIHGRRSKTDLVGHTIMDVYPGIEKTEMFAALKRCMEERTSAFLENEFVHPDKVHAWFELSIQPVPEGVFILSIDMLERKKAEQKRQAHLRFFEHLDQVNRAMQGSKDFEQAMNDVLEVILSIFSCDRAWLLHPCDPDAPEWQVPIERTRPEYPGAFAKGARVTMDADGARVCRTALSSEGPVKFGPGSEHALPADVASRFTIKSMMAMAIYPRGRKPYLFGLHQCSYPREWAPEDEALMKEVGRRLADAMTVLLTYRDLRESEENLNRAQAVGHTGSWHLDIPDNVLSWSAETYRMFGMPQGRTLTLESFFACVHPEDMERVAAAWDAAVKGASYDVEHRIIVAGETKWVRERAQVVFDSSGKAIEGIGTVQDITDKKRAENAIKSQMEELQRWHDVMLDREDRVQELKREVNDLCLRLGERVRYESEEYE